MGVGTFRYHRGATKARTATIGTPVAEPDAPAPPARAASEAPPVAVFLPEVPKQKSAPTAAAQRKPQQNK